MSVAGDDRGRVFTEVTAALLWPRLLRVGGMALRPTRMVLAFFLIVVAAILIQAADAWLLRGGGEGARGLSAIVRDQLLIVRGRLSAGKATEALSAMIALPARMFTAYPGVTMLLAVPACIAWGVLGGAIGRSASTEFGQARRSHWGEAIVLSARRWGSQALTLLLPLVFAGALAAVLAIAGKVMLGNAVTSVLGGLLFGVGALIGLVIVLVLSVLTLALPMLVPALLVEGTDSIDAIQRCFAYVVARPLKLVLYVAVLFVEMLIVTAVIALAVRGALAVTGALAALFLDAPYDALVRQAAVFGTGPTPGADEGAFEGWQVRAAAMIGFWSRLCAVIPGAYVVSFFFTGGSALYLTMRQVCDGQDAAEVWSPSQDAGALEGAREGGADDGEDA